MALADVNFVSAAEGQRPLTSTNGLCAELCVLRNSEPRLTLLTRDDVIVGEFRGGTRFEVATDGLDAAAVVELLRSKCQPRTGESPVLDAPPRSSIGTRADGILALFLARHWPTVTLDSGSTRGDIVFAHAIPLAFAADLWTHVCRQIDDIVLMGQLLLLSRADLILVDPSIVPLTEIERRHRRVLRANRKLSVLRSRSVHETLVLWSEFSVRRFDRPVQPTELEVLSGAFSIPGFTATEYRDGNIIVANSLVYLEAQNRILFDVLAPWQLDQGRRRPGIYTAVNNLLQAHKLGVRYSLCYGWYSYKAEVVRGLPEVHP